MTPHPRPTILATKLHYRLTACHCYARVCFAFSLLVHLSYVVLRVNCFECIYRHSSACVCVRLFAVYSCIYKNWRKSQRIKRNNFAATATKLTKLIRVMCRETAVIIWVQILWGPLPAPLKFGKQKKRHNSARFRPTLTSRIFPKKLKISTSGKRRSHVGRKKFSGTLVH